MLFFLSAISSVSAQSFVNHGIGLHLGFPQKEHRTLSPEYEIGILNNNKGYYQGYIFGAGGSIPVINETRDLLSAFYLKGGYRLSSLSFGIIGGTKNTRNPQTYDSGFEANFGGWIGMNISRGLKLELGADGFNGFKAGLVLYPNTVKNNRK
jgi:hypothetical protein